MKKSNSPHAKQRQRQKVSRKTIIIICALSFLCMVAGLTIFFNISHVDHIKATPATLIIVEDQVFTTDKTLEAPVVAQHPSTNSNTVFAKKAKNITKGHTHQ
jgi:hypothetical protein